MSIEALARTPLRNMLLALLLWVQLGCVLGGAFAAEAYRGAADIHHSYLDSHLDSYLAAPVSSGTGEHTTPHLPDNTLFSEHSSHGCDHCSHCHASHIGLFKATALLALHSEQQPMLYLKQIPVSPNRSIYRPPIA